MLTMWVIGLLGCFCGGISAFTKEDWKLKADEILHKKIAYINSENVEDMLTLYTETARVLPPGHPAVIGKKEIREYFMMVEATWKMYTTDKPEENIVTYTDEMAVVWYKFRSMGMDGLVSITGKVVLMMKKVDGEAKVQVQIWNYD